MSGVVAKFWVPTKKLCRKPPNKILSPKGKAGMCWDDVFIHLPQKKPQVKLYQIEIICLKEAGFKFGKLQPLWGWGCLSRFFCTPKVQQTMCSLPKTNGLGTWEKIYSSSSQSFMFIATCITCLFFWRGVFLVERCFTWFLSQSWGGPPRLSCSRKTCLRGDLCYKNCVEKEKQNSSKSPHTLSHWRHLSLGPHRNNKNGQQTSTPKPLNGVSISRPNHCRHPQPNHWNLEFPGVETHPCL